MPIRVLDAATVGRIAAGEVVERPSSIAKELVENALDAGATSITVEIKNGGADYLRVTDNGYGIPPEEVRMAFENHATSKISSGDSLTDILTMGFRGEALPSIAAVSRVTMTTRQKGAATGTRIQVDGGQVTSITEAGCPEGTSMVVKDLFYNTPVRRGFLKKPATEAGVMGDMLARLILANPGTAIRYINNGKTVYHSFGDGNIRHAALAVYGRETAEKLLLIDESEGALRICGLVGVGELARSSRADEFFFVNGRTVRVPILSQALEAAARTRVMIGQYPMCALSVTMPATGVDVNVHPSKLEVRFRDEEEVRRRAEALLTRALCGTTILDPAALSQEPVQIEKRPAMKVVTAEQTHVFREYPVSGLEPPAVQSAEYRRIAEEPQHEQAAPTPSIPRRYVFHEDAEPLQPEPPRKEPERPQDIQPEHGPIRVIGVYANTYIMAEMDDILIIIDQHAAHERILYERYRQNLTEGMAVQPLLVPEIIKVSQREMAILADNEQLIAEAGYEIAPFGEREIQVRAVPYVLGKAELKPLFLDMIDQLDQLKAATIDQRRSEVIYASCKHAVKGGDALNQAEVEALINEMLITSAPPNCPHGRPILKTFRKYEIEHMFKRV